MRPLRLELEGFGAFRDRTTVDLSGADLFAIVGATGHGKSTLIDAVCFALYGKVPRHGERDIAPVVTLGANEARVAFTFELGGRRYVATRVLRRGDKGAKTRGARLELVADDGSVEVVAGSVREVQASVLALVGLDFDQFTKCVVLPQGRFAEFLHASAGDRTAILSALLDLGRYDRVAAAARDAAAQATGRRAAFEQERARVADVSADALAAARARAGALAALVRDVEEAAPRLAAIERAIADAEDEARAAARAVDALAGLAVPADAAETAAAVRAAADRVEATARDAERAEAHALELEAARDEGPSAESLRALRDAYAERDALSARVAQGEDVVAGRAAEAVAAKDALVAARDALDAAQRAHDDAQRHHAHAELREALVAGEPCPVCEQPVSTLPRKVSTRALTTARRNLERARRAHAAADEAGRDALAELHKAEALLGTLRERLADVDGRLDGQPAPDAVAARHDEAVTRAAAATEARAAATAARAAANAAAADRRALVDAADRAEAALRVRREALVAAGLAPPEPAPGDLAARWDALVAWGAEARPEQEKRAAALDDRVRACRAERDDLAGELAARAAALGAPVASAAAWADLVAAVAAAARDADNARVRAEAELARAEELDAAIAATRAHEQVASELGRLLDKRHFGQWLVDEALHALVAGASDVLEQLSAGQYALTPSADGELLVVDHVNADETRSVRSLSGGETFQASLALALALAEHITHLAADGAAALESIFLDEGFGTLDPETLEVVAGTIESLAHGERVVGVVTHVAELAERMPTRLRVRKQGRTAVVTREDA
jgi:exonuclease SbcC